MTCCSELDILFKKQGVFIPRTDRWARNSSGKMTTKNTINYLIEKNFISPLMLFVSLNLAHGNMYLIQHYVIKFVSDLWWVGGFSQGTPVSSTNKTDRHDIVEILLKVALNTMTLTLNLLEDLIFWASQKIDIINYSK